MLLEHKVTCQDHVNPSLKLQPLGRNYTLSPAKIHQIPNDVRVKIDAHNTLSVRLRLQQAVEDLKCLFALFG